MTANDTNNIDHMEQLLATWKPPALEGEPPARLESPDDDLPSFDIAWAAGLFDGEGCIHIAKQRSHRGGHETHHLRASLTQNDLRVLQHFRDGAACGGRIYPVPLLPGHSRQVYALNYATADSIALLQRLAPHLVRKRAELAVARRFWQEGQPGVCRGPGGMAPRVRELRADLYREMRRLKKAPLPLKA